MELRRATDALLRSQASPLAALRTPSIASRRQAGRQLGYVASRNRPAQRTFITTTRCCAIRPQPTTSAAPTTPKNEDSLDDLAKSLNWITKGASRSGAAATSPSGNRSSIGNSASDLLSYFNDKPFARSPSGMDVSRMVDPAPLRSKALDVMKDLGAAMTPPKQERIPMRLTPSTGRTVTIGKGIDIGRGFRLLEQSCARNKVRSDFTRQRFHERGGLKRKRLASERWRKRFMEGFKSTVKRVKQLKNQGW